MKFNKKLMNRKIQGILLWDAMVFPVDFNIFHA